MSLLGTSIAFLIGACTSHFLCKILGPMLNLAFWIGVTAIILIIHG